MKHTLKRLIAHRATPWVALAAALLLIVWATAVSAQRGGPDAEDPQLADSRALAARYLHDRTTGSAAGDLRGAFGVCDAERT